jgi:hypothetical protein
MQIVVAAEWEEMGGKETNSLYRTISSMGVFWVVVLVAVDKVSAVLVVLRYHNGRVKLTSLQDRDVVTHQEGGLGEPLSSNMSWSAPAVMSSTGQWQHRRVTVGRTLSWSVIWAS